MFFWKRTRLHGAYDTLLDLFGDKIMFVNVVDPLVEAVMASGKKSIGVIATRATINSNIYKKKICAQDKSITVQQ